MKRSGTKRSAPLRRRSISYGDLDEYFQPKSKKLKPSENNVEVPSFSLSPTASINMMLENIAKKFARDMHRIARAIKKSSDTNDESCNISIFDNCFLGMELDYEKKEVNDIFQFLDKNDIAITIKKLLRSRLVEIDEKLMNSYIEYYKKLLSKKLPTLEAICSSLTNM